MNIDREIKQPNNGINRCQNHIRHNLTDMMEDPAFKQATYFD